MKYYIYKIYKDIIDEQGNPTGNIDPDIYIGSTVNLSRRKSHHKKNTYNRRKPSYWRKLYVHIRGNGGFDAFKFDILEAGTCDDTVFIRQREQSYIENLKPSLNINNAI